MRIDIPYIIGFFTALTLITLSVFTFNNNKKDINRYVNVDKYTKEIERLSENVNVINFISNAELSESTFDDEEDIIYPNVETGLQDDKNYFVVEDFIKYDRNASDSTIYKIKTLHIPQLERVRDVTGLPIIIKSSARSYEHELAMGRSGKSQHIFPLGKGAVDVSVKNLSTERLDELEKAVFEETEYTRVARYPTFLHLDYYKNRFGDRGYYRNTNKGWIYIGEIKDSL